MQAIGGKWKLHIIFHLMNGTHRFGELHRLIPGITHHTLTAQLRELEGSGLVDRKIFPQVPPRVDYSLTECGRAVKPVTDALLAWGLSLE